MLLTIPVWCFVMGAFAFIAAFNITSIWGRFVCVILGVSLWFLAVKEWRYQNRRRLTVKDNDSPIEKEFETKWRLGSRTAVLIVRLTNRFASEISLSVGEDTVNAKEIGVFMLQSEADSENTSYATLRDAGLKAGSRIRVTARGPDAAAAMDALSELFSCGARIDLCIEPGCPSPPMLTGYTPDIIHYGCSIGHAWTVSRSDASMVQRDA